MYKKLDNATWEEYINEYSSLDKKISIKSFCKERNINPSQFFYYRKRLTSADNPVVLQAINFKAKEKRLVSFESKINIEIANRNKKIFETSSEKVDTNQLSFFNEAEKDSDSKVKEPSLEEITYKRVKKNLVTGKKDNLANLERVVIEHKLEGEDLKCKKCGNDLIEMGIRSKKEILKYNHALSRSTLGKALDYA